MFEVVDVMNTKEQNAVETAIIAHASSLYEMVLFTDEMKGQWSEVTNEEACWSEMVKQAKKLQQLCHKLRAMNKLEELV